MRKTSTYGLRLDQIAALFFLSRAEPNPAEPGDDSTDMASLLREQLACVLPSGSVFCEVLLTMMGQMGYDTRPLAGRPLAEVLLSPPPDLPLLQALKDCSKAMSSALDAKSEVALATTIYYASLAAALVHRDRKITQHSYGTLDESFALLIEKDWMAPELIALFSRARSVCQSRRGET